ncbi:MAG: hypothetical protein V4540_01220 [Pseudomonadota bacterium]
MLTAVLIVLAVVAAWLLGDWLLSRRDERLQRGRAAWLDAGPNRSFHSTAWDDTVPPLEAHDEADEPPARLSRQRAAV